MTNLLFGFQGRINRARFWLVHIGIFVAAMVVVAVTVGEAAMTADPERVKAAVGPVARIVLLVFGVVFFWISFAVAVKRWHDRNKSGLWVLIVLVPAIGNLWYLIECGFLKGTTGPNS
jgi:uncharacterized membrane protein YhaH (DUF805 family)